MVTCCALGCVNRSDRRYCRGVTFHKFPSEPVRRELWIQAVKRGEWQPANRSVLCSAHFQEQDFDRSSASTVRLRPTAVPSKFPAPKPKIKRGQVRSLAGTQFDAFFSLSAQICELSAPLQENELAGAQEEPVKLSEEPKREIEEPCRNIEEGIEEHCKDIKVKIEESCNNVEVKIEEPSKNTGEKIEESSKNAGEEVKEHFKNTEEKIEKLCKDPEEEIDPLGFVERSALIVSHRPLEMSNLDKIKRKQCKNTEEKMEELCKNPEQDIDPLQFLERSPLIVSSKPLQMSNLDSGIKKKHAENTEEKIIEHFKNPEEEIYPLQFLERSPLVVSDKPLEMSNLDSGIKRKRVYVRPVRLSSSNSSICFSKKPKMPPPESSEFILPHTFLQVQLDENKTQPKLPPKLKPDILSQVMSCNENLAVTVTTVPSYNNRSVTSSKPRSSIPDLNRINFPVKNSSPLPVQTKVPLPHEFLEVELKVLEEQPPAVKLRLSDEISISKVSKQHNIPSTLSILPSVPQNIRLNFFDKFNNCKKTLNPT